jgi:hypothetical protein
MKKVFWGMVLFLGASFLLLAESGKKKYREIDLSTIHMVTGTVSSVTISAGRRRQSFLLNCEDKKSLKVYLGSYRWLVSRKFTLSVGDKVSAKVANCLQEKDSEELIALEVANQTTGDHIVIRDDEGVPVWSRGSKQGDRGLNP